jgi:type II secretory pathway component PulJ
MSILLVLLIMQFLVNYQRNISHSSGAALSVAALNAALDSLMRDCASAPADVNMWLSREQEAIAWKTGPGVQGFSFVHNRLVRISRKLNRAGKLQAASYSTILNNVEGQFTLETSPNLVSAIVVNLHASSHDRTFSIKKTIYLHEGVIS